MTIHFFYLIALVPSTLFDTICIFSYYNFNYIIYLSFYTLPMNDFRRSVSTHKIERNSWRHGSRLQIPLKLKNRSKVQVAFVHSFHMMISGLNMTPPGVPGQSRVFILITQVLPAYLSPWQHFKLDLVVLFTNSTYWYVECTDWVETLDAYKRCT